MSKASKHRSCPAVQREISSAECRENRVSRYACPASCAFNVLSPERYDDFILLERDVIYKAADRHLDTAPDRAAALREVERMANCPPAEQHAREISLMLFERDAQGRTLAGRWEAADFPGLSNDERVVFRAMMRPRLRLVEVRRILDGLRTEVVDLLETEARPFTMHDRSLTRQASRFACFIGWFYELPHLVRVSGIITQMPEFGTFEPAEVMKEIIRHLGGPAEPQDFQEWFARNSLRFQAAMMATSLARREAMFRSMDAEFGKAVYELRAPFAECRARLDETSDVAPDALAEGERNEGFADARVWFDDAPVRAPATPEAQPSLGRVLLGQAHWRLEALGAERLARLRGKFEQCFGEQVRFTGERRDDMAAHLQSKEPKYDPTLVPPRLLEQPVLMHLTASRVALPPAGSAKEFMASFQEHEDRAWIENTVPALNNRTPREAAKDPALRPILIRLLKNRVRALDERNLREGTNHDLTWLLRELGADEIVTEPPPRRMPLHQAAEAWPAALPNDDDFGAPDFDDPPPLPAEPFGRDEAIRRVLIALDEYETAQDAMDAMEEAGGFLIEDAAEIVGELLNETEFILLSGYLTQLWFALVPPGCWGPAVEYEDFRAAYGRQLHGLMPGANDKMEIAFERSAQPSLLHAFAWQILHAGEDLPQPNQVRDENRTLFLLLLNAAIEVLDAALRNEFSPEPAVTDVSNEMKSNNQPTPDPGAYGPPLAPLLTRGQPSSQEISDDEYARLGITHAQVPELIRMSLDEALNNGPGQSALVWAPVHAWRALAELRAAEAVVPLLGLLRRIDEAQDDWVSEQLPRVLGRIGPGAIGPVADYLANPAHGEWARVAAAQALRWMGEEHPAARAACVAALTRQLEQFASQSDTLNGALTWKLMDLRAVESMPVMERAFASGRVDESVCGDYEDVEIELGLKTKREHPPKPNKMTMMGEKFRAQWAAAGLPLPDADGHFQNFPKLTNGNEPQRALLPALDPPFRAAPKTGRNDPCPCGSGKKFKKCCGP